MDIQMLLLILFLLAVLIIVVVLYFLYRMAKNTMLQIEQSLKQPFSDIFAPENIDKSLELLVNNEKYQNFLVASGNFIGAGVKNQIGSFGGGGKGFSIEKLAKQALGGWLNQRFEGKNSPVDVTPQQSSNSSETSMDIK